jgi:hypothetical protein
VPVGVRGRRYAVFACSPHRAMDLAYFTKLAEHFERPEARAALLSALMAWTLDRGALRSVPKTDALLGQKFRTFDPVQNFCLEFLQRGGLAEGGEWRDPFWLKCSDLHQAYLKRCDRFGVRHMLGAESFGRQLQRTMPGFVRKRRREDRDTFITVYDFSALAVMRRNFEECLGQPVDWGADLEEMKEEEAGRFG